MAVAKDERLQQDSAVSTPREEARQEQALLAQVRDVTRRAADLQHKTTDAVGLEAERRGLAAELSAARGRLAKWRAG
jgi:hypothetical protein